MSAQFIRSARPGKPITWYVYAFRGGPLILKCIGPKKPKLNAAQWAQIAAAEEEANAPDPKLLRSLIRAWRSTDPQRQSSPEWEALSSNTKKVWGGHLDLIDERWGDKPISVWSDPRMVGKVMKWRDERAATPRSADIGITVLKALLEYGRLRGRVAINVAMHIPQLYRGANRAEIIWTDDDIEAFRLKAEEKKMSHVYDGLRLAVLTGLRRADLVTLTWSHLGEIAIVKTALKKSRGKRRKAIIPITEKLETLLAELRQRPRKEGVDTVLVNSFGRSWSDDGFGGSFNRIRDFADIVQIEEGEDGRSVRRKKHLHDARGTFCTLLLLDCELTDKEAAEIMAWSAEHVSAIRKVYVDQTRVVVALAERIAAKQIAKQSGEAG